MESSPPPTLGHPASIPTELNLGGNVYYGASIEKVAGGAVSGAFK